MPVASQTADPLMQLFLTAGSSFDPTVYFRDSYNTTLSEEDEKRFQRWLTGEEKTRGRSMAEDFNNYDLRGYWLNGGWQQTEGGHYSDTFKKPNHPTFSDESIYSGVFDPHFKARLFGGKWQQQGKS